MGGYDCPSAFTKNPKVKPKFVASNNILKWVGYGNKALNEHYKMLPYKLQDYYLHYLIPENIQNYISTLVVKPVTEVNLFGGNPEMHPEVLKIGNKLSQNNKVTLTTTGRRFLLSKNFCEEFKQSSIKTLALSLDDTNVKEVETYLNSSCVGLKNEWKKIDPLWGQKQKVLQAIYTLKEFEFTDVTIVLNTVIHENNIQDILPLLDFLDSEFKNVLINPYFVQSTFDYQIIKAKNKRKYLLYVNKIVNKMIEYHFTEKRIVKRLHYWLALRAMLNKFQYTDSVYSYLSGNMWKCYTDPILPYLQIGKGNNSSSIGGKLGCFWNTETISEEKQIQNTREVTRYLNSKMKTLASEKSCSCFFPRLSGNLITTELGLNDSFKLEYLKLRKDYLQF